MKLHHTIEKARAFAMQAHGDQLYGGQPYVVHLDAVYEVLREAGVNMVSYLTVAYFHDVLEDTPKTQDDLQDAGLSWFQIDAVQFCTDEKGPNRRARKTATYARVKQDLVSNARGAGLGVLVKFADRIANIRACRGENGNPGLLEMYLKESPAFLDVYQHPNPADPDYQALLALYHKAIGGHP